MPIPSIPAVTVREAGFAGRRLSLLLRWEGREGGGKPGSGPAQRRPRARAGERVSEARQGAASPAGAPRAARAAAWGL